MSQMPPPPPKSQANAPLAIETISEHCAVRKGAAVITPLFGGDYRDRQWAFKMAMLFHEPTKRRRYVTHRDKMTAPQRMGVLVEQKPPGRRKRTGRFAFGTPR